MNENEELEQNNGAAAGIPEQEEGAGAAPTPSPGEGAGAGGKAKRHSDGVNKRLGHLFRVNRKAKKMSVRVLSELTGIHPGAINKFELGKTDMRISRVFKIIGVLGISFDDIKILFLTSR